MKSANNFVKDKLINLWTNTISKVKNRLGKYLQ